MQGQPYITSLIKAAVDADRNKPLSAVQQTAKNPRIAMDTDFTVVLPYSEAFDQEQQTR